VSWSWLCLGGVCVCVVFVCGFVCDCMFVVCFCVCCVWCFGVFFECMLVFLNRWLVCVV